MAARLGLRNPQNRPRLSRLGTCVNLPTVFANIFESFVSDRDGTPVVNCDLKHVVPPRGHNLHTLGVLLQAPSHLDTVPSRGLTPCAYSDDRRLMISWLKAIPCPKASL